MPAALLPLSPLPEPLALLRHCSQRMSPFTFYYLAFCFAEIFSTKPSAKKPPVTQPETHPQPFNPFLPSNLRQTYTYTDIYRIRVFVCMQVCKYVYTHTHTCFEHKKQHQQAHTLQSKHTDRHLHTQRQYQAQASKHSRASEQTNTNEETDRQTTQVSSKQTNNQMNRQARMHANTQPNR